jgi:hypothetical protein
MTKHKTEDYKNSAVKYYLNNENGDGYKRTCKILIVKNLQYEIGLKDTKKLKILQEKIENQHPIKFQNRK